jgi:hypothetical protein
MQWEQFVPKSEAQLGRLARLRELCENQDQDLSKDVKQHPQDKATQGTVHFNHKSQNALSKCSSPVLRARARLQL